jgi:hypothetical protein
MAEAPIAEVAMIAAAIEVLIQVFMMMLLGIFRLISRPLNSCHWATDSFDHHDVSGKCPDRAELHADVSEGALDTLGYKNVGAAA